MQTRVILFNIRSAHNVGSIFRSSDGAGVERIYLVGATPLPIDRFGRPQAEITKTSLGASEFVPWEHIGTADNQSVLETVALIKSLQTEGFTVIAVEQTATAISLQDFSRPAQVAYIFGHEVDGVPPEILDVCDATIEIPMQGQKESLNVSVTAGIVLFAW